MFCTYMSYYTFTIYWLVVSTPLKKMKVSWDDSSQYMESHKSHVPVTTNQELCTVVHINF